MFQKCIFSKLYKKTSEPVFCFCTGVEFTKLSTGQRFQLSFYYFIYHHSRVLCLTKNKYSKISSYQTKVHEINQHIENSK